MKKLVASLMMAAGFCSAAYAQDRPKFKDYSEEVYTGRRAPLRLDKPDARQYRTRLREASRETINFGGRYVFTQWSAGSQCETGAIVDVSTGNSYLLPFAACFWEGYDRPFEFRTNSRLLVVAGQVGEDSARGAHFFEFTGKEFILVADVFVEAAAKTATAVEPASGPAEGSLANPDLSKEALKKHPVAGPLVSCYDLAMRGKLARLREDSADVRVYAARLLSSGGVKALGVAVKKGCDEWFLSEPQIPASSSDRAKFVSAFGAIFVSYVIDSDRAFYAQCVAKRDEAGWDTLARECGKSLEALYLP